MATTFKLKIRNPELRVQLEQITGAINVLETGGTDLDGRVTAIEETDLDGRVTAIEETGIVLAEGTPVDYVPGEFAGGSIKISAIPKANDFFKLTLDEVTETYTFVEDDESGGWAPGPNEIDVTDGKSLADVQAAVIAILADSALVAPGAGWNDDVLALIALDEGDAGNGITTDQLFTQEGDGFGEAPVFTDGLDAILGTPGAKGQVIFDATGIYVSVDESTETDSNWEHIAFADI